MEEVTSMCCVLTMGGQGELAEGLTVPCQTGSKLSPWSRVCCMAARVLGAAFPSASCIGLYLSAYALRELLEDFLLSPLGVRERGNYVEYVCILSSNCLCDVIH